jgi:hypothetical protein
MEPSLSANACLFPIEKGASLEGKQSVVDLSVAAATLYSATMIASNSTSSLALKGVKGALMVGYYSQLLHPASQAASQPAGAHTM